MIGSDSDDDYDPAEVTVKVAAAPAPAVPPTGDGPLSRADIFNVSRTATTDAVVSPSSSSPLSTIAPTKGHTDGGYRLQSDIKGRVRCVAISTSGTTLCAGSEDGQLCMWDFTAPLKTHRVAPTRVLTPFVNRIAGLQPIIAMAWSRDDRYLIACQDGDSPALVKSTGQQLGYCAMGERGLLDAVQCRGHRAPVTCVAAHHSDGAAFFTGSQDGTARLWKETTYNQRSTYAVKHGSGQLTDTHVVESVASLPSLCSGQDDVFASGGQDGFVQLWDARVKYRPGGALSSINMYDSSTTTNTSGGAGLRNDILEKHVGGMTLLVTTAAGASAYSLAVRVGPSLKLVDLRQGSNAQGSASRALVHEVAHDLSFVLDTTCVSAGISGPASFLTCTSRTGYNGHAGAHVLGYEVDASSKTPSLAPTVAWRAAMTEAQEDVLCVCADASRADGAVYAGLSSGAVAVHGGFAAAGASPQPLEMWLQTRPEWEDRRRQPGVKAARSYDEVDADLADSLF